MLTAGDKDILSGLLNEISSARSAMDAEYSRHVHIIGILRSLKACRILVESRVSPAGVIACIDLLPGIRHQRRGAIATLNMHSAEPNVEFGKLLSNCLANSLSLIVSSSVSFPGEQIHPMTDANRNNSTTLDLVRRGQLSAVDFAIVEAFQTSSLKETYDGIKLSRISVSKHLNDFAVVFTLTGSELLEPVTISIKLAQEIQETFPGISQKLRKAFLHTNMDDIPSQNAHLLAVLVDTIKAQISR